MPMEYSRSVIQGIHVQGGFNESVILKWFPTKGVLYIIIILILITPRDCTQTLNLKCIVISSLEFLDFSWYQTLHKTEGERALKEPRGCPLNRGIHNFL